MTTGSPDGSIDRAKAGGRDVQGLYGLGVGQCRQCQRPYSIERGDRLLCCICERDLKHARKQP